MRLIVVLMLCIWEYSSAQRCTKQYKQATNRTGEHITTTYWKKCLTCENVNLYNGFSIENEADAISLTIQNSFIDSIPVNSFSSFTKLEYLFLNKTSLTTIIVGSFEGLKKLEALYLRDNKIKTIPKGALSNLSNLRFLDISVNAIAKLEDISLAGLFNLEELVLPYNSISEINQNAFTHVKRLRSVDLAHNKLASIDDDAFLDVPDLERLLINDNVLEELPEKLFANLTVLRILDVSDNELLVIDVKQLPSTLENFHANGIVLKNILHWSHRNISRIDIENNNIFNITGIGKGVHYLSLRNNSIPNIHDVLFENAEDITHLDLGFNAINKISENAFKHLKNLERLYLNNNNIKNFPVGCFRNQNGLTFLKLSWNNISSIDEFGTFFGLTNLAVLYLDHNRLQYINEKTLYVLKNLQILDLTNNALKKLDALELLEQVPRLVSIALDRNSWTCDSLIETVTIFATRKVALFSGTTYDSENVNGIVCYNPDKLPPGSLHKTSDKEAPGFFIQKPSINPWDKYFEKDFTSSKFYKFFNSSFFDNINLTNSFVRGFRKTSFYKFFENDFLNSSFVRFFNKDYKQNELSKELNVDNTSTVKEESTTTISSATEVPTPAATLVTNATLTDTSTVSPTSTKSETTSTKINSTPNTFHSNKTITPTTKGPCTGFLCPLW